MGSRSAYIILILLAVGIMFYGNTEIKPAFHFNCVLCQSPDGNDPNISHHTDMPVIDSHASEDHSFKLPESINAGYFTDYSFIPSYILGHPPRI
jgi:hypothetical protein